MSKLVESFLKLFSHTAPEVTATKEVLEEVGTHLGEALTTVLSEHEEKIVTRVKALLDGIEADIKSELSKISNPAPSPAAETPAEAPQAPAEAPKASK